MKIPPASILCVSFSLLCFVALAIAGWLSASGRPGGGAFLIVTLVLAFLSAAIATDQKVSMRDLVSLIAALRK